SQLRDAVREEPWAAAQQGFSALILRQSQSVLGLAARRVAAAVRARSLPFGDVRLAGHRLPGRAHAVRVAGAQLLLWCGRSRGVSEGSLLLVSERVDRAADAPSAPALELGFGRFYRRLGLLERRRSRAVLERHIARHQAQARAGESCDVARRVRTWNTTRRCAQRWPRLGDRRGADRKRAGAHCARSRPPPHPSRTPRPVLRYR